MLILFFSFFVIRGITKSAIYTQLQSDNGRNAETVYDAKVCLVVNYPLVRANGRSGDRFNKYIVSCKLQSFVTSEFSKWKTTIVRAHMYLYRPRVLLRYLHG